MKGYVLYANKESIDMTFNFKQPPPPTLTSIILGHLGSIGALCSPTDVPFTGKAAHVVQDQPHALSWDCIPSCPHSFPTWDVA